MTDEWRGTLEQIDDLHWRVSSDYKPGMRVDGIVYTCEEMMAGLLADNALEQVANVATLPGIQGHSLAMPDIHWGYGFCIGGVAATDPKQGGVVSPGGVGYDINCGVRLVATNFDRAEVDKHVKQLIDAIFRDVPCGVGRGGQIRFSRGQERKLLAEGAPYVVKQGFGWTGDADHMEAGGCLDGADPDAISDRAYKRGEGQCGSLGSGNHFLEVQVVDEIYDPGAADAFGLREGQITIMIHSGSRGLGHQVCDDYLKLLAGCPAKYGVELPDRQLVCAPVDSPEGRQYLAAMRGAANYAWANRQILTHLIRGVFERTFGRGAEEMGMRLIYDVAHNIAKLEEHTVDGRLATLCVHRKGATRAFPPGHPDVPEDYRAVGQPVIIPGDMGTASYLLVGAERAMAETFGTTCHGAGRTMSRHAAIRSARGRSIKKELARRGVYARAHGRTGLDEEQPDAYKDVDQVVDVVHRAGLSRKVCRMRPLGVVKG